MKFFISLMSLFCLYVYADDVIVIKGGREIHGQITGETETHYDIYTDYGRQLHIHKTRITNVARAPQANVQPDPSRGPATPQTEESIAGTNVEKKWRVGLELGPVSSGVDINPAPTTLPSSKSGLMFGFLAEYPITSSVYLNPEVAYSQLGYKSDATTTVKYNFVKIPLLLKYKYPIANKFTLNGFGGFSIGILTGATTETATTKTDVSATTKSTVYGLEIGAGGEYAFTERVNLFLNLRYAMALNSVDNTIGDIRTYKLRDLGVLFGILYRI